MRLVFPDNGSVCACVCGIDPGTNRLGLAAMDFNMATVSIQSIEAETFRSELLLETDDLILEAHSERTSKIYAQKDNLVRQFRFYRPYAVCCESPFYNRLRPSAYGPLMEILFAIRMACIEYDRTVKLFFYEPSVIKKAVGAHAIGSKDAVKQYAISLGLALLNLAQLQKHG